MSLLFSFRSLAAEVDYLTRRYEPLENSTVELDENVNARLKAVIDEVQKKKIPCDGKDSDANSRKVRALLRDATRESFYVGVVEYWAEGRYLPFGWYDRLFPKMNNFPASKRHDVHIWDSIYSHFSLTRLNAWGLNGSVSLAGEYIGTDKFGHFFDEGYKYFFKSTQTFDNGKKLSDEQILVQGKTVEEVETGEKSTGVLSYADLAANYSGFQFWKRVTGGEKPYFVCDSNGWRLGARFRWSDYVNPSWDEGINCSDFETDFAKIVEINIKKLEAKARRGEKYRCPISVDKCIQIEKLPYASYYVHEKCLDAARASRTLAPQQSSGSSGSNGSSAR